MMKKKELWIINHYATPAGYGGLTRHYYFAKYLQEMGYNVKIFASSAIHNSSFNFISKKEKKIYKESIVKGVKYVHIKTRQYEGNKFGRVLNMIEFYFRCQKVMKIYAKKSKPDYIYSSTPQPLSPLIANKFAKKIKVDSIVETRDLWPETFIGFGVFKRNHPTVKVLSYLIKKVYTNATKLVFTMEGAKEYLKTTNYYDKIKKTPTYYLNNGVDLVEFKNDLNKNKIKDKDLEDKKTFKVAYAGSIRYIYNIGQVIDVAKICKDKNKNIKFLIYGRGPYKEELEKKCIQEKIDNVIFKGFVDSKYLPYALSKVDLNLLHERRNEVLKYGASQNKLFLYLAAGKPIVSTSPNKYNIVSNYKCGLVLENGDNEEYANKIIEIANSSEDEYKEYCKNAKAISKEFDYKKLTKKLKKILED